MKIARKEAKESLFWLKLLKEFNQEFAEIDELIKESVELRKILSSIINKVQT
ncbi:four helix bundle protein [Mesonia mobilis]|uniref:four helix bundle protein n=1 Tax=Mesonia mobilis TaxID=369791 RepID=UPI0024B9A320|nr:four helix bundle protein [Mesonia mobilis]